MKRQRIIVYSLVFVFILISASILFYKIYFVKEVRTLKMYFEVTDKVGINLNDDALYFGKAYPGSLTARKLNFSNTYNYSLFVSIKIKGSIAQFAKVSENNFVLNSGEDKEITYYVETSQDTPKGNYTGETKIVFNKALLFG